MPTYTVTWKMEFDAEDPISAAEQARLVQLDREQIGTVFYVARYGDDNEDGRVRIDLWEGTIDGVPFERSPKEGV